MLRLIQATTARNIAIGCFGLAAVLLVLKVIDDTIPYPAKAAKAPPSQC